MMPFIGPTLLMGVCYLRPESEIATEFGMPARGNSPFRGTGVMKYHGIRKVTMYFALRALHASSTDAELQICFLPVLQS